MLFSRGETLVYRVIVQAFAFTYSAILQPHNQSNGPLFISINPIGEILKQTGVIYISYLFLSVICHMCHSVVIGVSLHHGAWQTTSLQYLLRFKYMMQKLRPLNFNFISSAFSLWLTLNMSQDEIFNIFAQFFKTRFKLGKIWVAFKWIA